MLPPKILPSTSPKLQWYIVSLTDPQLLDEPAHMCIRHSSLVWYVENLPCLLYTTDQPSNLGVQSVSWLFSSTLQAYITFRSIHLRVSKSYIVTCHQQSCFGGFGGMTYLRPLPEPTLTWIRRLMINFLCKHDQYAHDMIYIPGGLCCSHIDSRIFSIGPRARLTRAASKGNHWRINRNKSYLASEGALRNAVHL